MENEGLPNFITFIVSAVILGVLFIAGMIIYAILTMPPGG
jgi:succinate dehydrogenase hydrophobic anchor subunit